MNEKEVIKLIKSNLGSFYTEVSSGEASLSADVEGYFIEVQGGIHHENVPGASDEDEMGRLNSTEDSTYYSLNSISKVLIYEYSTDIDFKFDNLSKDGIREIISLFEWNEFNTYI